MKKKANKYADTPDISSPASFLIPNPEIRGVGQPAALQANFLEASAPYDPNRISGSDNSISMASIPSPIIGKYIRLPDGTVSTPSLAFASDADTGLYRAVTNSISVACGGVRAMHISNTGALVEGRLYLLSLSPSSITSDQNNYAPESSDYATFWRLTSDAARTITGIGDPSDGRMIFIANIGSFNIILANQSGSSDAANRIITGTGASVTVEPDKMVPLIYDGTTLRWRVMDPRWLTTKGDLLTTTGTVESRLAVGTNGKSVVADSSDSLGLKYYFVGAGFIGAVLGGNGRDGALSLGSSTVTLSGDVGIVSYTTLNVGTGSLTTKSTNGYTVFYATLITGSGGSIICDLTGTGADVAGAAGGAGGTGASGGASGGSGGKGGGGHYFYAKSFTGSGVISVTVGSGSNGNNATAATATGNGSVGTGSSLAALVIMGYQDSFLNGAAAHYGNGGTSAGTGGTGNSYSSSAGIDTDVASLMSDLSTYFTPTIGRPDQSSFVLTDGDNRRRWSSHGGGGGGAGGRNNGGAQGAGGGGGGGSGQHWFNTSTVAGGTGGAGGAGGSGSGGGGGGGGGTPGFLLICSLTIASGWTFRSKGGAGGNGGNGFDYGGGGGGGTGGEGGYIVCVTMMGTDATFDVAGGAGGTGGSPGASGGASGSSGSTGNSGTALELTFAQDV